jgi:predicted N-acetyltransferase YhbS
MTLRYRPATADDIAAVAALHADSWRRHYRGALSDEFLDGDVVADRLEVWTDRLSRPDPSVHTIVAEEGGDLVGFVCVVLDADAEWGALVDNLHVTFDRKRGGVGRELLRLASEFAGGRFWLWVLEQNTDAQAFYDVAGGRCVERAQSQPRGADQPFDRLRYAWD